MKKNIITTFACMSLLVFAACFKEKDNTFDGDGTFVEFQTVTITAPSLGRTYPLVPAKRGAGTISLQVNLVGRQRGSDESIKFVADSLSTATAGVHYRFVGDGAFNIPANSSTGTCQLEVLNPVRDSGKVLDVVLRLEGNASGDIKPSENYRRVGYRITF